MQTTGLDQEQKDYADTAVQSSRHLTRLLSDILDLARVEAGKLVLQQGPLNVHELMEHLCVLFKPSARQAGLELTCRVDQAVPRRVLGDAARVNQVLTNLLGNALKFTRSGGVHVGAEALSDTPSGLKRVLFTVSDSGSGISADGLDRLFEPFTQADDGLNRRHEGAGLGLSISRHLVALMGGHMSMESEEGLGTTVYLALGFEPADEGGDEAAPETDSGESRGLRILLAEDAPINQLAVQRLLEGRGHRVTAVTDGRRAIDALRDGGFDLVLMDVQMPVMDGDEATRAIRRGEAGEANRSIPIIALTAYAMTGDRERFLKSGMDEHIAKPVDMKDLVAAMNRVMKRAASR